MSKSKVIFLISLLLLFCNLYATSLQQMYDNATSKNGYDKYIILEKDSLYTGAFTQDVDSVFIEGNGCIIEQTGNPIELSNENYTIIISRCVFKTISNSQNSFIILNNNSTGKIINNTFWCNSTDNSITGIILNDVSNNKTEIINNIFYNLYTVVYVNVDYEDYSYDSQLCNIEYNLNWNCTNAYLYWGGWTGPAYSFIPQPGNGERIDNPDLIEPENNDFSLKENSICIDNGCQNEFSFQGNAPDLGAIESDYSKFRGTKISENLNHNLIKSNSPYIITDNLYISNDEYIQVDAGVEIKINSGKSIFVDGNINLNGTIQDSILITNNSYYNVGWSSFKFNKNSSNLNIIKYSNISNGRIVCSNDSLTIENCKLNDAFTIEDGCKVKISDNDIFGFIQCDSNANPLIENNTFHSAGIRIFSANPRIIKNIFTGQNYKMYQTYWTISLNEKSNAIIEANLIKNNYGAILVRDSSSTSIVNNLIYNCENGISIYNKSLGTIINNTIYANMYLCFGICGSQNSKLDIFNSIVWNTGGDYSFAIHEYDNTCSINVRNCVLSVPFSGAENMTDYPSFIDTTNKDFNINDTSNCIDAGITDSLTNLIPKYDFAGNSRIVGNNIDIGCYENQNPNSIKENNSITAENFILYQNYPNPFNPTTTISYYLPKKSFINLSVYNIQGKLVKTLISENKNKGNYKTIWNAGIVPSGIYYYKLSSDQFNEVTKCLLIK